MVNINEYDYKDVDNFVPVEHPEVDPEQFFIDNDDVLFGKFQRDETRDFLESVAYFKYECKTESYFELMQLIGKAKDLLKKNYNGR